ncbi:hypothetical protein M0R72_02765 [Candidatus Pacearchaeota archaeon]|jgi:hypothetical protein|nr:hypothetical protein [Candidatus Pacearchaeota archaeon]
MKLIVADFSSKFSDDAVIVNTTSRAHGWSRGLSPFLLGPVKLYGEYEAQNVENAWQYSKVYTEYADENNEPGNAYFEWAKKGWAKKFADRYPMGRGNKPLYSLWDGRKLGYIEARRQIYIPLYSNAVRNTEAFEKLTQTFESVCSRTNGADCLVLQDFDAHGINVHGYDVDKLIDNEKIKVGHGYVLAMMLLGLL